MVFHVRVCGAGKHSPPPHLSSADLPYLYMAGCVFSLITPAPPPPLVENLGPPLIITFINPAVKTLLHLFIHVHVVVNWFVKFVKKKKKKKKKTERKKIAPSHIKFIAWKIFNIYRFNCVLSNFKNNLLIFKFIYVSARYYWVAIQFSSTLRCGFSIRFYST